jgi:probable HAF family extracellular repeat protein
MPARHVPLSLLLLAVIVVSTLTTVNFARGARPGGTTAAPYAITDLGSPGYSQVGYWSKAYGINEPDNLGVTNVIGWDYPAGFVRESTIWEVLANGDVPRTTLGAIMKVTAVNDHGLMIVGAFDTHLSAIVPGVGAIDLPGSAGFFPAAVNNLGHIVAQQQLGDLRFGKGAMWTIAADGSIKGPFDLGDFRPLDINDWDEMAGLEDSTAAKAWFKAGALEAALESGALQEGDLTVAKLPGLSPGNLGVATAINNGGDVVGYSTDVQIDSGTFRPFLWTPKQGLRALGSLGGIHGKALGINDGGQIVGWSYTNSQPFDLQRPFLWQDGKMFDLNGKIAADKRRTLVSAHAINNAGHIVGDMYTIQGGITTAKSFLLTPNP